MKRLRSLIPAMVLTVCFGSVAWSGPPTDQVREYTDQVRKVLDDPALKQPDKRSQRRAAVRKVAIEIFDVAETAKRALGPHWQSRTEAERTEFTQMFADLLERTYISKIDLYGGEQVRYVAESIDGDRAIVRAKIITKKGTEVPVDARMLRRAERWLIYDITVENISLINNYRVQFDRIIRTSSYEELMRRLRKRDEFLDEKESSARRPS